jgi:hypothetical protein
MSGHAVGGNDLLLSGRLEYGDAETLSGHVHCGNDTLTGNTVSPYPLTLYGDGQTISDHVHCGNDSLTGGASASGPPYPGTRMYGDGQTISGHVHCGDDTLSAASAATPFPSQPNPITETYMYGDGESLGGWARAGDDVLISGKNCNDQMWGDAAVMGPHVTAGRDLFVFQAPNGHDQIMDFQPGQDRIELKGFCFRCFQDLASHFQATPDGVLISFDANDDILLRGVTKGQLHPGDFLLG